MRGVFFFCGEEGDCDNCVERRVLVEAFLGTFILEGIMYEIEDLKVDFFLSKYLGIFLKVSCIFI